MIHHTWGRIAASGVALLNAVLAGQKLVERSDLWWGGILLGILPLPLIWFPGVFAEMGRWGLMASLASDYSQGIPPIAIRVLGWMLMFIMTAILIF